MISFEEIYAENHASVFRVAKKMMGDGDAVSDIIQDVFIDLYNKLNNGNEIRYPKSWLYRVTYNKCIDNLRKQKRFQNIESVDDNKCENEATEKLDLKAVINTAIATLKPREKMLAVLYSEGLSYKEIAEATGLKMTSIGKLLSRTLEKLESEFKKEAMGCINNNIIQKYIDREVTPEEVARIENHIAQCEKCAANVDHRRKVAASVKKAINLLAGETIDVPGMAVSDSPAKKRFFTAKRLIYIISAACILIFTVVLSHKKEPEIGADIIMIEPGFAPEFDANRTVSQQQIIITIIDSKGRSSEYFE